MGQKNVIFYGNNYGVPAKIVRFCGVKKGDETMNRLVLLSISFVVLSSSYSYGMEKEFPSWNSPIKQFKKSEVKKLKAALFVVYRISTDIIEDSLKVVYGRKNCTSYEYVYSDINRFLAKKNYNGFIQYGQRFDLTDFDDGKYIGYLENNAKSKENKQNKGL